MAFNSLLSNLTTIAKAKKPLCQWNSQGYFFHFETKSCKLEPKPKVAILFCQWLGGWQEQVTSWAKESKPKAISFVLYWPGKFYLDQFILSKVIQSKPKGTHFPSLYTWTIFLLQWNLVPFITLSLISSGYGLLLCKFVPKKIAKQD